MKNLPRVLGKIHIKAEKFLADLKNMYELGLSRETFASVALFAKMMAQGECRDEDKAIMSTFQLDPIQKSIKLI